MAFQRMHCVTGDPRRIRLPRSFLLGALAAHVALGCTSNARRTPSEHPPDASHGGPDASRDVFVPFDAGLGWVPPPDGSAPTYAPTFYAIYFEILRPTCSSEFCHLNPGFFGLATPELAYATLVGQKTSSRTCGPTGLYFIAPGLPDQSLLYLKVTTPPCGRQMPTGFGVHPLSAQQTGQIREWILRGAPEIETTVPADGSADARPDAPGDASPDVRGAADASGG